MKAAGSLHSGGAGRGTWLVLTVLLLAGLVVLLRTAWMCDDAYITLRCSRNLLLGHGPTYNLAERVQAFTNPLWMLLSAGVLAVTGDEYHGLVGLSLALSLGTLAVCAVHLAPTAAAGVVTGIVLLSSRAFVDYSTSGLETPASHLLLALFAAALFGRWPPGRRRLFLLALLAGLLALNRLDTLVLTAPVLAVALAAAPAPRWPGRVAWVGAGFLPLLAWLAFSVVYYGFPLPNTAPAKLTEAWPRSARLAQGARYLWDAVRHDPVTPLWIAAGVVAALLRRRPRELALAAGMLLYVAYVGAIGGDFMSGRLWTLPFLGGTVLAARSVAALPGRHASLATLLAALLVVALSWIGGRPPWLSGPGYGHSEGGHAAAGIDDERAVYYPTTGLLRAARDGPPIDHPWAQRGRDDRERGVPFMLRRTLGFYGWFAGPSVHVVDVYALADPLLARIPRLKPAKAGASAFRPGHLERAVPEGYWKTLTSGENRIAHPALARCYDALALATRGPLWSRARWRAILDLNTGRLEGLVERYLEETRPGGPKG